MGSDSEDNVAEKILAEEAERVKRQREYAERNARNRFGTHIKNLAEGLLIEVESGRHHDLSAYESLPPFNNEAEKYSFFEKKVWDELAEPILEYESLKKDIEDSGMSNTKKKAAMQELNERRARAEDEFQILPEWQKQTTDQEKQAYIKRVAKTLRMNKSFHA